MKFGTNLSLFVISICALGLVGCGGGSVMSQQPTLTFDFPLKTNIAGEMVNERAHGTKAPDGKPMPNNELNMTGTKTATGYAFSGLWWPTGHDKMIDTVEGTVNRTTGAVDLTLHEGTKVNTFHGMLQPVPDSNSVRPNGGPSAYYVALAGNTAIDFDIWLGW